MEYSSLRKPFLLAAEAQAAAGHLRSLVNVKSLAPYEPRRVTTPKAAQAVQHAERLIAAMELLLR